MRQRLNPIFIILNNGTYAVEEVRKLLHCCLIYVTACKLVAAAITASCSWIPNTAVLNDMFLLQMIHPGEYNVLKVWNYVKLAEALSNDDGTTFAAKVRAAISLVAGTKCCAH
jgi:TPP-dependent 2-oxoacid decarboxylase